MKSTVGVALVAIGLIYWWRSGPQPVDIKDVLEEYDFIVVGSGSSGGILATRLSENPSVKVLLLEAGPMDTSYWNAQIPGLAATVAFPGTDWDYYSTPMESGGHGFKDRKILLPRGRILGGTSQSNWMYYTRCHAEDYDEWEAMGNAGWGYQDVLKYFHRMEGVTIEALAKKGRNTKGPVGISYGLQSSFGQDVAKAIRTLNIPFLEDGNIDRADGFFYVQANTKNGRRQSTAESYIRPNMHRENFHVVTNALVTKVNFNAEKEATGVTVQADGLTLEIKARKEVILSAGAYNSPQILMWSGIGPKAELKKAQVDPVHINENVGQHLEDHAFSTTAVSTSIPESVHGSPGFESDIGSVVWLAKELVKYAVFRGDSQLGRAVFEIDGLTRSGFNDDLKYPDLQLYIFPILGYNRDWLNRMNYNIENLDHHSSNQRALPSNHRLVSIGVCHLHPQVRGSVTLNNSDPVGAPVIDYQAVREKKDRDVLVEGYKQLFRIFSHPLLSKYNLSHPYSQSVGCKHLELTSDAYWHCIVDHHVTTVFHPTSTCKMGPNEKDSVVDSRLRVHGVQKLRVADASIMPHVPSGNTNAPCMMIGEKTADMIKQDHEI